MVYCLSWGVPESWENLPLKFLDLDLKLYKIFSIN